jgi:DNA-directed RNA polymerase specialized sigma24 family protein
MDRAERRRTPSVEELFEAVRNAPEGDVAPVWALWARMQPEARARVARFRPPASMDAEDFRQEVLSRVEGRFLSHAGHSVSVEELNGKLGCWAYSSLIDAVRRRKVHDGVIVPLPGADGDNEDAGRQDEHLWVTYDPAAAFDGVHVDPAVHAEIEERSLRVLGALERLAALEPARRQYWAAVARAVRMRHLDGRPRSEVALELGLSERQTDRYITAGLAKLAEMLGDSLGSEGGAG